MTTEVRARLGQKLAGLFPGDMDKVFFTLGGAEANENALRMARQVTGRNKVLARYRSYHGATYATISLTGDPRRWGNEPSMPGVIHVLDPYHGTDRPVDDAGTSLRYLEETIELEGPATIAAFILEPVTGTNGILIPPDGYLQGVRELCDPARARAALATLVIYEEDGPIENARRMGEVMRRHHEELLAKHPSVGLVRNIGLFGVLELVRNRATMEPLAPFNGASEETKAVAAYLDEHGLYTFVRWNHLMTNPPLCIDEALLAEGFEIVDAALEISDRAVTG